MEHSLSPTIAKALCVGLIQLYSICDNVRQAALVYNLRKRGRMRKWKRSQEKVNIQARAAVMYIRQKFLINSQMVSYG